MQIFLNLFGARCCASRVLIKYLLVDARVREPEEDGAGECFPHLPPKTIRKSDLDQPGALGIP